MGRHWCFVPTRQLCVSRPCGRARHAHANWSEVAPMTCIDVATAAGLELGRKSGAEQLYRCPHPDHHDEHPSLSIHSGKDKWMCGPCGSKAQGGPWTLAAHCAGVDPSDKPSVVAWLIEHGLMSKTGLKANGPREHRIVKTYSYQNKRGELLYEVVRYEPKSFSQRRPDGPSKWIANLDGVRRVLYRLSEVLCAETVYIVEGEKDVDNLRSIGLTATCNSGGAGKWRPEYAESFKSHQRIVVIPDADEPGRKHAQQVAATLAGKVASLKILELPNLPLKGDVSDWLASGGTRTELEALVGVSPEFVIGEERGGMRFTSMRDFLNEPEEQVQWLVEKHLPLGGDSLLVAKPKVGKSTLARCCALAVARGEEFLGCKTTKGAVLYLALEEKRTEVRRHFQAMGIRHDEPIFIFCATSPADGMALLCKAINEHRQVLVIVDPLFRFVRVRDVNDYAAVTNALEPLHALARESGAHVLAVHHIGKGDRQGGDAVLGSTALFAAVDTLLTMKRNDKYRTLSTIQRYGTDLDEITLEYNQDTRTLTAGVARAEADLREAEKAVLEFLKTQAEAIDERTIQDAIDGRKGTKSKALRRLAETQRIERTGTGKKGDPYLYKNAGIAPPNISRGEKNQNLGNELTDSVYRANAGSRFLANVETGAETWEPVISPEQREEIEL